MVEQSSAGEVDGCLMAMAEPEVVFEDIQRLAYLGSVSTPGNVWSRNAAAARVLPPCCGIHLPWQAPPLTFCVHGTGPVHHCGDPALNGAQTGK